MQLAALDLKAITGGEAANRAICYSPACLPTNPRVVDLWQAGKRLPNARLTSAWQSGELHPECLAVDTWSVEYRAWVGTGAGI